MSLRTGFIVLLYILPVFAGRTTYHAGTHHSHTQGHTYPSSTGLSGNRQTSGYHNTVHNHYYSPPQQVTYGSHPYPVYHGAPPVYVNTYINSGSRFDTLLAGLALYNLGKMSQHHPNREYRSNPGETCKFKIAKSSGNTEIIPIDCKLISSFIWESEKTPTHVVLTNVATTVVNTTNVDGSVVTTNTTTVVDALQEKGPSIQVTPEMKCFLIRNYGGHVFENKVDCGLLQEYSRRSFRNSAWRNLPLMTILVSFVLYCIH